MIHSQRRSLAVQVYRDGRLVVRAPLGVSPTLIHQWVSAKGSWIAGKQQQIGERFPPRAELQHQPGACHHYLGESYQLWPEQRRGAARFDGAHLSLPCSSLNEADVASALARWQRRQAEQVFPQRVESCWSAFAAMGLAFPSGLRIRQMKSLWGSMSSRGVMTLNLKLIRAPLALIDYVVYHELCHLKYYHHGPLFHGLMDDVLPDWRERKRKLEALGL